MSQCLQLFADPVTAHTRTGLVAVPQKDERDPAVFRVLEQEEASSEGRILPVASALNEPV